MDHHQIFKKDANTIWLSSGHWMITWTQLCHTPLNHLPTTTTVTKVTFVWFCSIMIWNIFFSCHSFANNCSHKLHIRTAFFSFMNWESRTFQIMFIKISKSQMSQLTGFLLSWAIDAYSYYSFFNIFATNFNSLFVHGGGKNVDILNSKHRHFWNTYPLLLGLIVKQL